MAGEGRNPKYHPDTLEDMAHAVLSEIHRRVDDLVDGDVSGIAASLTSLMRILKELAPDKYETLAAATKPQTPAQSVIAAMTTNTGEEWGRYGIVDPLDVKAWQALGTPPENAHRYLTAGLTPFDVYQWDLDSPENISIYRDAGWSANDLVPTVARDLEASAREAMHALTVLRGANVTSVSLRAVILWSSAFPDEVTAATYPMVSLIAHRMSPDEAKRWDIPLEKILEWVELGHTRTTYETIVDLGGNPMLPFPHVPSTLRWRLTSHDSARLIDEQASLSGWEQVDARRTEVLSHISWRAYTNKQFRLQVRFTHDVADFAEVYTDDKLVGFVDNCPDLASQIADTLLYPVTAQANRLGLYEALLELQDADWEIETNPKGELRGWYDTAPPAYYGLTVAQVHTMLGRHQLRTSALDAHWVDLTMSRNSETFNMAATTSGEILVVTTPTAAEGLWGDRAERTIEKFCR